MSQNQASRDALAASDNVDVPDTMVESLDHTEELAMDNAAHTIVRPMFSAFSALPPRKPGTSKPAPANPSISKPIPKPAPPPNPKPRQAGTTSSGPSVPKKPTPAAPQLSTSKELIPGPHHRRPVTPPAPAALTHHGTPGTLLLDAAPISIGIEVAGGQMAAIGTRSTAVPTKNSETFSTYADNQTTVIVAVYEGERQMCRDNTLLGKFEPTGIPPAPRGAPQIEVSFRPRR